MHVPRDKLRKGINDGDDGFAKIVVLHAGGPPQRAGAGHVAAIGRRAGAISGHGNLQ